MSASIRASLPGIAGFSIIGLAILTAGSACSDDRGGFDPTPPGFAMETDAGECPFQCSLDGRSVIRACSGEIVETCPSDRACGAALCQEPCAAAAADRSSNGCDFYFQIPRYDAQLFDQSCYAAFIVNTSIQPVDVTLEYDGKALDISKSLFRTNPGDATLMAHTGPINPGESAVLFVSDRDPTVPHVTDPLAQAFRARKACPPGVVPALLADIGGGTRIGPAFRVTTNVPIGLTAMYPFGGATSYIPTATLLLPVPTWAKEHILVNGWEANVAAPGAQFIASEDATEVTIVPTHDIQNGTGVQGALAGTAAKYRLDKGQYLQFSQVDELSGSIVEANKPIAAFGGHACSNVPSEGNTGDAFHQQIPPFEQWGSEYVGVGYRPRAGNEHEPMAYRIVAARDGTRLDYDPAIPPGAPTEMSAGEVVTFRSGTGDAFVVRTQDAEHPVYLAAYMTSSTVAYDNMSYGAIGDPEFVNVIPTGQYLSSYSFYADPTYGDASLVIVRAKRRGVFEDVWLECAGGNLTDFRPIGTRGDYEFTRVDLAKNRGPGQRFGDHVCQNGLQRTKSEGPFTATIWGWDYAASYAYPGGMAQRKLVATPLVPVR
ncbi:hypothetical protein AKJ09_09974 [Labilithrix luteola]|uniref:IgGFc-binding protein N-terminal domain-containing protein n=1 Tax=Labilithrix luteola TaxID=1391654 RepID=A0A0K1QC07_9BACT|nr:IgGFc-binding protein [Labilithrix luteola]AKV03311.1 hypothetical protein AKJ09_09974 [Labilithrix luteola]